MPSLARTWGAAHDSPTTPASMGDFLIVSGVITGIVCSAALKERGHVTEEEFNAVKRDLLGATSDAPSRSQRLLQIPSPD